MKNEEKSIQQNRLQLIPKIEQYIEYILNMLIKIPRTEKFSIGSEYKISIYQMLERVIYLNKINDRLECIEIVNRIDTLLNCQRIYLRVMKNNHWIDEKKFNIAMEKIYEMGKIIGGLYKYYAKDNKK